MRGIPKPRQPQNPVGALFLHATNRGAVATSAARTAKRIARACAVISPGTKNLKFGPEDMSAGNPNLGAAGVPTRYL